MKSILKNLPENVRQTVAAGVPLVIVIILFILVGRFGVSKVLGVQSEIKSAKNTEGILTQKLSLLQTLSTDAASKTNMVSSALPAENPSLAVISQLKALAGADGIVLSAVKSGAGPLSSSGLNEANISFTVEGARAQVFTFLANIAKIAPITIVNKISVTEAAGNVTADISVRSFWADFPKTIPSVTTPITDFTAVEKTILTNIAGLTQPSFMQVTPSQAEINPNPFGQ
ncbi:MAG: hypothetical protein NTZ07_02050 [Candidatus Woesebacteria bacterium]|nr:hypothetical protein [Candidatus Woesebacteria bacterium]